MVDRAALTLGGGGQEHFLNDLGKRGGGALDGTRQRVAPKRAEADGAHFRGFVWLEREAFVIDHQNETVALHCRAQGREIERDDLDAFEMDVLPDVELGPVRDREHADAFALGLAGVVEAPEFGALVFRVPAVVGGAEGKEALFRTGLLFVTAGAAKGYVETVQVECLLQTFGFPHVCVQRAMIEGVDPFFLGLRVLVDNQIHSSVLCCLSAKRIHVPELPRSIDMQLRERWRCRVKGLLGQMKHDRAVFTNAVEHHRSLGLSDDLAEDVDAFCLKALKVRQCFHGCQRPRYD